MAHMQQALLASGDMAFVVTVGSDGAGFFGYTGAGTGSISPSPTSAINGATLSSAGTPSANDDFQIVLSGSRPQTQFSAIRVEDASGAVRIYNAADATFSDTGITSTWTWGFGLDDVWTNPIVGQTRDLTFIL